MYCRKGTGGNNDTNNGSVTFRWGSKFNMNNMRAVELELLNGKQPLLILLMCIFVFYPRQWFF